MNRIYRAFYLACILFIFGTVVVLADPLILRFVVYAGLVWIGLPCLAISIILLLYAATSRRNMRPQFLLVAGILAFASLAWIAVPMNRAIQERAVTEAKAYPDRIAPLLEQYRQAHGSYPASLDQLRDRPHVPRLLRTSYGYSSNGRHYTFTFSQPGGMIDVWDYSDKTHKWHLST